MPCPFHIVDVFSSRPFTGNPVAVIFAPDEDEATMRRLAGWTGMPETVFVTRPGSSAADYALRIFSPARELAFAGHPSIGACHLLVDVGLVTPRHGKLVQECRAGLVEMRVDGQGDGCGDGDGRRIGFSAPIESVTSISGASLTRIGRALGRVPETAFVVQAGARWIVAPFEAAAELASLTPSFAAVGEAADDPGALGISVYSPSPDNDADVEVRSFAPSIGVNEDAVCGGGNACVAAVIAHLGRGEEVLTVSQGRHLGRRGRVRLSMSASEGRVSVTGQAVTSVSGTIALPG